MVLKAIAPKLDEGMKKAKRDAIEHLFRKSKRMKAVLDYVHNDNALDVEVKKIKEDMAIFLTRVNSQSDRLIAIEKILKKVKKFK